MALKKWWKQTTFWLFLHRFTKYIHSMSAVYSSFSSCIVFFQSSACFMNMKCVCELPLMTVGPCWLVIIWCECWTPLLFLLLLLCLPPPPLFKPIYANSMEVFSYISDELLASRSHASPWLSLDGCYDFYTFWVIKIKKHSPIDMNCIYISAIVSRTDSVHISKC